MPGGEKSTDPPARRPFLDSWYDPVAQIKAYSPCFRLANLDGDGNCCLILGDQDCKLRVLQGTSIHSEHTLLDIPVSINTFYTDSKLPRTPALAVASGSHVYIYRNLRPYYKFSLPTVDIAGEESQIWTALAEGSTDPKAAVQELASARDKGISLSSRSLDLLGLDKPEQRLAYVEATKRVPLKQLSVVTCMEIIRQDREDMDAVSSLVIGTEACDVLLLSPMGSAIDARCTLPSVPQMLAVVGLKDVNYRVVVGCRDGNIYQVKNGQILGRKLELESGPVALIALSNSIVVACMDRTIHSYTFKGRKNYSIHLPSNVTSLETIVTRQHRTVECYAVGLAGNEVRVYNGKHLVSILPVDAPVTCLRFGSYGREANTLLIATKAGSLFVKMLRRGANLETQGNAGPPPEQDVPLALPKKTKLYIEQTQRERDHTVHMHRTFQAELTKMRLNTARAFVKITGASGLGKGGSGRSSSSGVVSASNQSVRINARLMGFGPKFRIVIDAQNTGVTTMLQIPIVAIFNQEMYKIPLALQIIPLMIPGLLYHIVMDITNVDQNGGADEICICLCEMNAYVPMIAAIVKMPICEIMNGGGGAP